MEISSPFSSVQSSYARNEGNVHRLTAWMYRASIVRMMGSTTILCLLAILLTFSSTTYAEQSTCLRLGGAKQLPVTWVISGCQMHEFEIALSEECNEPDTPVGKITWQIFAPAKMKYRLLTQDDSKLTARFGSSADGIEEGVVAVEAIWTISGNNHSARANITFTRDPKRCPDSAAGGICNASDFLSAAPPPPPASLIQLASFPETLSGAPMGTFTDTLTPSQPRALSGDISVAAQNVAVDIPVGRGLFGEPAGVLTMREALPSKGLATAACWAYDFETNSLCTLLCYPSSTTIRQLKVPEGLVNIVSNSAYKYTMQFYRTSNIGSYTNPLYALSGSPFATVTIENPDTSGSTSNRIRITAKDNKIYDYEYSTNGWKLTLTNSLAKIINSETWSSGVKTERTEVRDASDALVSYEISKIQTNEWGSQLLESVVGTGTAAVTNTCSYSLTTNGSLKTVLNGNGSWQISAFDKFGRVTNVYKSLGNQTVTNSESLCHRVEYDYSTNVVSGSGDIGGISTSSPRRIIEKILGQEISRTYFVYLAGEIREIKATTAAASWNDAANLVTITKYLTNANRFQGKPYSVERADATMDLLTYLENPNGCITNTVWTGKPDGSKTSIIDGTKTVYAYGNVGQALSVITTDIVSGLVIESTTYS